MQRNAHGADAVAGRRDERRARVEADGQRALADHERVLMKSAPRAARTRCLRTRALRCTRARAPVTRLGGCLASRRLRTRQAQSWFAARAVRVKRVFCSRGYQSGGGLWLARRARCLRHLDTTKLSPRVTTGDSAGQVTKRSPHKRQANTQHSQRCGQHSQCCGQHSRSCGQ